MRSVAQIQERSLLICVKGKLLLKFDEKNLAWFVNMVGHIVLSGQASTVTV